MPHDFLPLRPPGLYPWLGVGVSDEWISAEAVSIGSTPLLAPLRPQAQPPTLTDPRKGNKEMTPEVGVRLQGMWKSKDVKSAGPSNTFLRKL